jgi:tRNA_anti-like
MRNLIIVLALTSLIGCSSENAIPVADLTVAQFSAAFEKDEKAAESLYEGKTIFISGVVTNSGIIRETRGINLKSDNPDEWAVLCLIHKSESPSSYSADFEVGKKFKFIGTVKRIEDRKFIHITDCRFA